jgi:LytS/YehU family sensor histidine kinase
VLPRLPFRPTSPPGRVLVHAAVILAGGLLGAELAYPVELLRHGELDPLRYRLQHYRLGILFSTALVGVMAFYDSLRARQLRAHEERAAAEQRARLAQLEALQVRTDPHFLFNVLNAIACLVELEPGKGVEALERLGALFRRVLDQSMAPTAALRDELAIVRDYLAIEALRHDHLRYAIDADDSSLDAAIPPLLVQPLVENAVKHGAAATADDVEIRIEARRVGGVLRVEVRDDARPELPATPGAGKSLAIIRERLALTHGDAARCGWSSTSPAGSVATLELPLRASP